jgi:long-subunit fatty acid transport protein
LLRGLIVAFSPTYSTAESLSSRSSNQVDVQSFTLALDAAYQINRYTSVFAGYTFLHQRTGRSSSGQFDADQNRVRVGVQFGYPFTFN